MAPTNIHGCFLSPRMPRHLFCEFFMLASHRDALAVACCPRLLAVPFPLGYSGRRDSSSACRLPQILRLFHSSHVSPTRATAEWGSLASLRRVSHSVATSYPMVGDVDLKGP